MLSDETGVQLRLSAQRALWGNVPASLRAVSLEMQERTIIFRAVFAPDATDDDREMLSIAATEVIADFDDSHTMREEHLELDVSIRPPHLAHLAFLRAESH